MKNHKQILRPKNKDYLRLLINKLGSFDRCWKYLENKNCSRNILSELDDTKDLFLKYEYVFGVDNDEYAPQAQKVALSVT